MKSKCRRLLVESVTYTRIQGLCTLDYLDQCALWPLLRFAELHRLDTNHQACFIFRASR